MAEYHKTIELGKVDGYNNGRRSCRAEVKVEIATEGTNGTKPRLSICGEVWNHLGTDIISGGQNYEELLKFFPDSPLVERIVEIWQRWHLNDMRAGCEHQRAEKWSERPIDPEKPLNAYGLHFAGQGSPSWNMLTWVTPSEHPGGLLTAPCPVCGYEYGSAWLYEPLPEEVINEVKSW